MVRTVFCARRSRYVERLEAARHNASVEAIPTLLEVEARKQKECSAMYQKRLGLDLAKGESVTEAFCRSVRNGGAFHVYRCSHCWAAVSIAFLLSSLQMRLHE